MGVFVFMKTTCPSCGAVFTPPRNARSLDQNALYHAICSEVSSTTGYNNRAVHEFFKAEFLGIETFTVKDTIISRPRSTTGLTVGAFNEYLEQVKEWCATNSIDIQERSNGRQQATA